MTDGDFWSPPATPKEFRSARTAFMAAVGESITELEPAMLDHVAC